MKYRRLQDTVENINAHRLPASRLYLYSNTPLLLGANCRCCFNKGRVEVSTYNLIFVRTCIVVLFPVALQLPGTIGELFNVRGAGDQFRSTSARMPGRYRHSLFERRDGVRMVPTGKALPHHWCLQLPGHAVGLLC